jgi:RNA polymerase sigma-70 factor (ECF subfamily)
LRIVGIPQSAQEALEETFTEARQSSDRFDASRGSEAAWLISIARKRGAERLRARPVPSRAEDPLQLAYFDGLSPSEISERLGDPVDKVRNTLQLEMKKLRDRLRALHP